MDETEECSWSIGCSSLSRNGNETEWVCISVNKESILLRGEEASHFARTLLLNIEHVKKLEADAEAMAGKGTTS